MTERRIGPNVENDMNFYTRKKKIYINTYLKFLKKSSIMMLK